MIFIRLAEILIPFRWRAGLFGFTNDRTCWLEVCLWFILQMMSFRSTPMRIIKWSGGASVQISVSMSADIILNAYIFHTILGLW